MAPTRLTNIGSCCATTNDSLMPALQIGVLGLAERRFRNILP
jgi:hypothetical protein